MISNIIKDLVDSNLLEIKAFNINFITFPTLPDGYYLINDTLMYNLSILNDVNDWESGYSKRMGTWIITNLRIQNNFRDFTHFLNKIS